MGKHLYKQKLVMTCIKCNRGFVDALVYWSNGKLYEVCENCRQAPEFIEARIRDARKASMVRKKAAKGRKG